MVRKKKFCTLHFFFCPSSTTNFNDCTASPVLTTSTYSTGRSHGSDITICFSSEIGHSLSGCHKGESREGDPVNPVELHQSRVFQNFAEFWLVFGEFAQGIQGF